MRFTCNRDSLMDIINIVQKAASTKTTMAILEGVLIEAYNSKLTFTSNDLEIAIECVMEADIDIEGSTLLSARTLSDVIRKLPSGEVFFDKDSYGVVNINTSFSHFELKSMEPSGFPKLPAFDADEIKKSIRLPQVILKEMIRQTVFAVSDDDNRPVFKGVYVENSENTIKFIALDGYKFALRKEDHDNEESPSSCIIPGKTLLEVSKILQGVDNDIFIDFNKSQIMFSTDDCKVVSRLIEGEYLNYKAMIPKEFKLTVSVNTKDLLLGIERASLVSSDERKNMLNFSISNDKIVITCNGEYGSAKEDISCETFGDKLEIGFNSRNIIDTLKVIDDDYIKLNFTTSLGPCTITPREGDSYIYLVMPVRLK